MLPVDQGLALGLPGRPGVGVQLGGVGWLDGRSGRFVRQTRGGCRRQVRAKAEQTIRENGGQASADKANFPDMPGSYDEKFASCGCSSAT